MASESITATEAQKTAGTGGDMPADVLAALHRAADGGKATVRVAVTDAAGKRLRAEGGGFQITTRPLEARDVLSWRLAGKAVTATVIDGRRLTGVLK